MDEESRAAAHRAQEARRIAYMQQRRAQMHGSEAARQGLYERTKALIGVKDIGSTEEYELEEFIVQRHPDEGNA